MLVEFDELKSVAHKVADAARVPILKQFRSTNLTASNKLDDGNFDPVTVADRDAELAMRRTLSKLRPDDGIVGEEFENISGTTGINWVLDPIDGTRAFICGATSWGVLISVESNGEPIYGIIDQPYTAERFEGGAGKGQLTSGTGNKALRTRECPAIEDAILLSTFPEIGNKNERQAFEKVSKKAKLTRYGLDCYGYALVALGQSDLVIEAGLQRYDVSAPIAVVEAAGGIVTNWQGENIKDGGQVIAAGDARAHAQAIELLNS